MKKVFITLLSCLFIGISSDVVGQGMEFFDGTFEEALALAEKEDKAVFVDAYTTWCGPCKRMSKYVFTEDNVGSYYNANFVNLKLNMEKEEGMKFKLNYPVSAYPTLYYIKPDGEVLYTTKGGRNPEQFIDLGKKALLKFDRTSEFADMYEEGDRSFETVYNYIKGLNKSGKSCAKVANDYIGTQSNLTTKENLLIIYESMTEMDSRMYDLFDKYKKEILAHVENGDYEDKVRKVADQTLDRAIEFKEPSLLSEAQDKRKSHLPEEAKSWNLESQMKFSSAINDGSGYLKSAKKYEKKFAKNANSKNSLVKEAIVGFQKDEKVMKWAADIAEEAIELGGLADYHLTYAYTQYYLDNREEAMKHAEKAIALAKEQNSNPTSARNLLAKLKG